MADRKMQGQQSGSKRPETLMGSARPAPKKGEIPPKGTREPGASKKTRPEK
jgi:hypothetical protein